MRSLAALAISLIIGLSLAMPPAPVGAQGPTYHDINSDVTTDRYCPFPIRLQVTGQQRILLLPQGARIIMSTRTATVTNLASGVSATVDASGNERESTLPNEDIQTMFTGRNLFAIDAENLAKWNVPDLVPGLYLVSGQVTKTFHRATGTETYELSPDAELINLCGLID
jgi:hypothetical protein